MDAGRPGRGLPALPARPPRRGGHRRGDRRPAVAWSGTRRRTASTPRSRSWPGASGRSEPRQAEPALKLATAAAPPICRRHVRHRPTPSPTTSSPPSRSRASPCAAASCAWAPPSTRSCTRHDYPEPVANLLGEACALAALVGSNLKFDGRLIVQAQGDGPVRYVVADYDTSGGLRGYCRFDAERVAEAVRRASRGRAPRPCWARASSS